jgi:hypothetical protein
MRGLAGKLSPEDRFYWKFIGGLYVFYVALMIVTVGVVVGNHLSKNLAQPALADEIGGKPPASIEAPMSVRHAATYD